MLSRKFFLGEGILSRCGFTVASLFNRKLRVPSPGPIAVGSGFDTALRVVKTITS